jgi:predicted phage replisome organizer
VAEQKEKSSRRYYWIKLKNDYFGGLVQKKMRKEPRGEIMQIIYLKMMLKSCDSNGVIVFQGVFNTLEEELAVALDEQTDDVKKTLAFMKSNNLMTIEGGEKIFIPEVVECTGSEGMSAERVRKYRKKRLQCYLITLRRWIAIVR